MNSSTEKINSCGSHPYEGAVHSSDKLLSSTGPSFQNTLKGSGYRKQHLEMENEFGKDSIFPTSYSENTQCKSSFTETSSHEVQSNKTSSILDSSSINKSMMNYYGDSDEAANKAITCTSNLYDSEEAKSRIRDATSNKTFFIPTDSYRFDSSRYNFEKPQEEEKNPILPRNTSTVSIKDNQKDNLHQVWGSDFKPTQHLRNDGLECPFDMGKASSNPKLPINSLSSEMGVKFDMNSYNNWKIQDRAKARTSKGNNFPITSITSSNSIAKDEYFEDSYGPPFLDQTFEKSNVAFSQHFHHQSAMSFHEGEYESRSDPSCDLMRRGHHDTKITTPAYDNASSMVTTTTATFPPYRSHYNANDLLPCTQSIPICYGPSHFESGYGVMSLSAFNEMYKTTTTNTHFQPQRFNDIMSSDTFESQFNISSTSTEALRGEASPTIENFAHVRAPSLTDGSLYSSHMPLNSLSPRHMYYTANNTTMDREDMLNQKIYTSFSSSLLTPPPLIKSPVPVSTNSSLDHSNINLRHSDDNKSNNKSLVESEILNFRKSGRPFERQDTASHILMSGPKEDASKEKMNGNVNSFYNAFNLSPTPNLLEPNLFSYPNELSPDSTTKNVCRICGKTYARPSTLKTHMRTHSGERPYKCFDCNKSFSQAANLTAHCRTHSGEKPFHCGICNRTFSQSSSVTTHMRTHSGERPYRCKFCKKAFSDSSTLTKHLRIHSGEKPYQCKLCKLKFSQSGNLNRHMRIHEELHDVNLQNMTDGSNSPILNMSNSNSQDMFPMTIQHDNYPSYNDFGPNCSEADKQ